LIIHRPPLGSTVDAARIPRSLLPIGSPPEIIARGTEPERPGGERLHRRAMDCFGAIRVAYLPDFSTVTAMMMGEVTSSSSAFTNSMDSSTFSGDIGLIAR
jgi:hypothetical protein